MLRNPPKRIEMEELSTDKMKKAWEDLKKYKTWVPPGHYYSPIPDQDDIIRRRDQIYQMSMEIDGVDLRAECQHDLLQSSLEFYEQLDFSEQKDNKNRYHYQNAFFSYGDCISLYYILRHYQPTKVVEVGSGFSSAAMLDINDQFFDRSIEFTFIEPYTERLKTLLRPDDRATLIENPVQGVDSMVFSRLKEGDVLFIDSTHVSKVGSDVNHLFFDVLPRLAPGVLIHIHDISANFELPYKWVMEGRAWNESYLLRAFLMYNQTFELLLFNAYLGHFHKNWLRENMPLFMKNPGGSLWLRKVK